MHFSFFSLASLVAAAARAFTVNAPASVPGIASNTVSTAFLGMGIESTSFPSYTGNHTHPNNFSLNLFASIINRTGNFPIRIGGDSRDVGIYVPTQNESVVLTNPNNLMAINYLGPSFLDGLDMVPGASWVLGVPFMVKNLSNAIEFLNASLKVLPAGSLDAVELGNEPNEYPNYSPSEYVTQWVEWAEAIHGNLSKIGARDFWTLSVASYESTQWDPENVYKDTTLGKYANMTKAVSMHYYQDGNTTDLQGTLLDHAAVAGRINSSFYHDVEYLATQVTPPLPLILGEGGPAIGANSSAVQHSLGTAVWYVDFLLYAMTRNIHRVNTAGGHDGPNGTAASLGATWLPVAGHNGGQPVGPSVNPTYYSNILVADLLAAAKGGLRVAELAVSPDGGRLANGSLVAYAAYDAGKLASVVLLNEQVWTPASGGARPSASVTVSGLAATATAARLEYLTGADSDTADVTWADQQWTVESNGMATPAGNNTRTVKVSGGAAVLTVDATQVVVLTPQ